MRLFYASVLCLFLGFAARPAHAQTQASALTQRMDVQRLGFAVRYPPSWSASEQANVVWVVPATAEKANAAALQQVPQIFITTEKRRDHADAVQRLREIASEYPGPVTYLTVGGWPAMQRSVVTLREQPGGAEEQEQQQPNQRREPDQGANVNPGERLLHITTAIAAGSTLIRAEGRMPPNASRQMQDQARAIETGMLIALQGNAAETTRDIRLLRSAPKVVPTHPPASKAPAAAPHQNLRADTPTPAVSAGVVTMRAGSRLVSFLGTPTLKPGLATRVINGGLASEPEIAVSTNGQNIVIAQQFQFSTSNDGGKTFPFSGSFPSSDGGDTSLAFGRSGNFYEGTIFKTTSSLNVSTDSGRTFTFRQSAYTCPASGPNQCGFTRGNPATPFPDQEHIAADRFNAGGGGDQVYFAWRNGNGTYGISCSTDGGQNFGAASYTAGDFPRITAGQDGLVYVVYMNGGNINLNKYSSCQAGLAGQAGFPVTVASGISVNCPVAGLDRCNNGNQLHSHMVAVNDTNANHVYVAYAQSTSSTNENVVMHDSTDGGATWPAARAVTVSSAINARRFMPWVCTAGGVAHATWYDRRASTAANNDLTDYYAGSAFLNGAGNLTAGTEVQINAPGSADGQCNAGKVTGSAQSWPGGSRASGDSTTCSLQPQLGGSCRHTPNNGTDSFQACNFAGLNTCPATETCQTNSGWPKYGDYNGNACAAGRLYSIWASATPPPSQAATGNVDLFFASSILCCSAQIQIPGPVVFPDSCSGQVLFQTANVCNTGKVDLSIDPITSSDPAEFAVTTPSSGYPVTVAPGACFPFQVRFQASAPGFKSANLTIPSNDPVTPSATLPVSGNAGQPTIVTAIASGGDFGTVCPGAFKDLETTIQNSGKCPLVISGISSSSSDFKTATVLSFPMTIAPGGSVEVPIRFEPTSEGAKTGTIRINSNDPGLPSATVAVKGMGGQPTIATVIADTGNFGTLCRGLFRDLPLTIQNNGTCTLHVTNIASSSPEFETASVQTYPLSVAPGVSIQIPIRYRPTSSGNKTGTITVSSDDPAHATASVAVSAHTPPEYICHPPTFAAVEINAGPTFGPSRTGDFSFGTSGRFLTPFGVRKTYGVQAQGEYLYYNPRQEGQFDAGLLTRVGPIQPGVFTSFKYAQWSAFQNGSGLGQMAFTLDFLFLHGARFGLFGTKSFRDYGVLGTTGPVQTYMRVADQFGGSGQVRIPLNNYLEGNVEWLHRYGAGLPDRPGATLRFVHHWSQFAILAEGDFNETFIGRHDSGRLVFGLQFGHWPRPSDLRDKRNPLGTNVPRIHYELLRR